MSPTNAKPTAFICAMPMELTPLVERLALQEQTVGSATVHTGTLDDREVVATVTGMGTQLATEGTERLLDAVDVERVIVFGITGALENETPIGTLVMPEVVVHSETGSEHRPTPMGYGPPPQGRMWTTNIITPPEALPGLLEQGVISLDMETAAIAAVCEARGIPWAVFRVISDRASDGTVNEEIFRLSNQDGSPNAEAIQKYFEEHPERLESMAKLAEGAKLATERAADAAIEAARAS